MIVKTVIALAAALAALPALAQTRAGKWEFYLSPVFTESKNYSFEGGATAHSDTGTGLNLGFAKNFSPHVSGGIEFTWTDVDYRATLQPGLGNTSSAVNVHSTIETRTVRFLGNYYLTPGNIAPFVTGGLGWTYIDTNIPSGPPQGFCWYYPWYGQYCGTVTPTHATTRFSYNVGAGLRMDIGNGFVRGLINEQYADVGSNSYSSLKWTQFRLDFGVKY